MSSARSLLVAVVLALLVPVVPAAAADDEQILVAPFECGTEWQGGSRPNHGGPNAYALDLNRTSLVWPDPLHDLNQPILAQADGTVVWVANEGYNSGAGAYIEIDYGDVTASYIHLVFGSIPHAVGDTVRTGDLIGLLGNTGSVSSNGGVGLAHLHLSYKDSRGQDNARFYLLSDYVPVRILGVDYIASPENDYDAPPFVSTNCNGYPFFDVPVTSFAREAIALLADLGITEGSGLGQYEPAAQVSREQMAAFLARLWRLLDGSPVPAELEMPFADAATSFAADDIALLAHLGITAGDAEGGYSPGEQVSREQMAAFLARLWRRLDAEATTLPGDLPMPFDDASASFAADDIAVLLHLGITAGDGEGGFSPGDAVTREQMAAFLARLYDVFAAAD